LAKSLESTFSGPSGEPALPPKDDGFTLVELLITMTIFGVIIAMVFATYTVIANVTKRSVESSDAVTQARLGLAQIDRQVRSGNVLFDPALESLPMSMRIYTQSNGTDKCVQWQVTNRQLRYRSWTPDWQSTGNVTAWRTVAYDIDNDTSVSTTERPFTLEGSTTQYGSRLVDVTLYTRATTAPVNQRVLVSSSLSGRNTIYGYDAGICTPVPAP
jgi:prepilin-type N-terminal cleavage/methylation domain-containing protein